MNRPFNLSQLAESRVTAVIVIDDADNAGYLTDALLSGGVNSIELTLRTDAAFDAMEFISKRYPEMIVGAGTVLYPDQVEQSIQSGAVFAVAPGLNPEVVKKAQDLDFPFAPGICTPSELERAISLQCSVVKFFPAEPTGGIKYLKSLAAPYSHLEIKFFPLGGISLKSMTSYLDSELVLCIGGSWIAKRQKIIEQDWKSIKENSRKTASLIKDHEKGSYE